MTSLSAVGARSFLPASLLLTLLALFLSCCAFAADAGEKGVGTDRRQALAVTIYNEDLALIKDRRLVDLTAGVNRVAFREVSARIRPETALLRNLSHPEGFSLIEQNFDYDLLTPQKLLEKYVGREVRVVRTHPQTGEETFEQAKVLAANNGVVLRIGDRIETGIPGRLVFPRVPENLRERPTLTTLLESGSAEPQELELSYLSGGLSWRADYVAELSVGDDRIDLSGWITLENRSGTDYEEANLQLVAGDVHRVREELQRRGDLMMQEAMARAPESPLRREALFEYHLYSLDRPTTIRDNQTKQVALLSASGIEAQKEYVLRGADFYYRRPLEDPEQKMKVGVFLEFANRRETGLGAPLPKGIVRVYKLDESGGALFVGEDRIDHTAENETVRLKLGEAFDVTATRKQTDFDKLRGSGAYDYVFESAFFIELNNAKEKAVVVRVVEPMPGDWEILEESHPHVKEAAGSAAWAVLVPAKGNATLSYRVRVRY